MSIFPSGVVILSVMKENTRDGDVGADRQRPVSTLASHPNSLILIAQSLLKSTPAKGQAFSFGGHFRFKPLRMGFLPEAKGSQLQPLCTDEDKEL